MTQEVAYTVTCPQDAEANSPATIAIHGLRVLNLGPLPDLAFERSQGKT